MIIIAKVLMVFSSGILFMEAKTLTDILFALAIATVAAFLK